MYIEKYNATKIDRRKYLARPQILFVWCDIRINIGLLAVANRHTVDMIYTDLLSLKV